MPIIPMPALMLMDWGRRGRSSGPWPILRPVADPPADPPARGRSSGPWPILRPILRPVADPPADPPAYPPAVWFIFGILSGLLDKRE